MNTFKTASKRALETRLRRKSATSGRIRGTPRRPRVSVFRSHKHIAAQIIDDTAGRTLVAASSLEKEFRQNLKHGGNVGAARVVAAKLAERAKAAGLSTVVFDKGWYRYHGRIQAFADALRQGGLKF